MGEQRLMTFDQVCEYLQVSETTFRRMVAGGAMPRPIMITPRTPRWDKEEINRVIEGGR